MLINVPYDEYSFIYADLAYCKQPSARCQPIACCIGTAYLVWAELRRVKCKMQCEMWICIGASSQFPLKRSVSVSLPRTTR